MDTALIEARDLPLDPLYAEEPDEWLQIDSNDFEALLQSRNGATVVERGATAPSEHVDAMDLHDQSAPSASDPLADREDARAQEHAKRLQGLADQVEKFVDGEGELEGARFEE